MDKLPTPLQIRRAEAYPHFTEKQVSIPFFWRNPFMKKAMPQILPPA
jgi:hypothetical protein